MSERCSFCGAPAGEPAAKPTCLWLGHGRMPPRPREAIREAAQRQLAVALAACTENEIREAVARELARRRQSA